MKKISILVSLLFITLAAQIFSDGIKDAVSYSKNSTLQWNIAMETMDLVQWAGSERVLDIGCGDGKVTALVASKLTRGPVLGVDISHAMIDFACSNYPQAHYPNLAFERCNGSEISFEDQFDYILSFSTLHWILDQEKALKAFHRALVPGGKLCLHTYGSYPMGVTIVADQLVHTQKWAPYFASYTKQRVFFTEEEYDLLLKQSGFEQIHVIGSHHDTPFSNRQALIDFVTPILNFISHLSENLQKQFVEEVADAIIAIAGISSDGTIHYRHFSLRAVALKAK